MVSKMAEPYMGMYGEKLWSNQGIMGRFVGPIEDTYLEYVQHHKNLPQIDHNIF